MKVYGRITVFPIMPARISRLYELAYNLWWSWHPEARSLYRTIDPDLWERIGHNPVHFLSEVAPARLEQAAEDTSYLRHYDSIISDFDRYMHPQDGETWFSQTYPELSDQTIAYFSAEFGLHESLPIYSGGLGILSGDHCKEASDLGLPFVGIGFLYPQGYFQQQITRDGVQEAIYDKLHFSEVPATPAVGPDGNEVVISVDLPGRKIYAKIWKLMIGRIPLYLMDTDVAPNAPHDRELAARLYGGDREMRISQEIVLGIGGVRALRALGIAPSAWHINEGHAAFLGLERCRELVAQGLSFNEASEVVAANTLFTTHTPVPAGNDTFNYDVIDRYFGPYWDQLHLNRDQFMDVAREDHGWGSTYGMTVLALHLSGQHNGVSKLHGAVSRAMWQFLWPGLDVDEVPIGSITNGVHTSSWIAPEVNELFQRYLGEDWSQHIDDQAFWDERIASLPDEELWLVHRQRKEALITYARQRLKQQHLRVGEGTLQIAEFDTMLNPDALILGFARRFATYKRAALIFRDIPRLRRILDNPERPVQIVFAGKAHPADDPGKALIEQIYRLSRSEEFRGKIVLLENYDIDMARYLISGTDLWLNNPIRPYEASGTSGQKAALNGQPNCSILDGWWSEGYNGKNGWAIGEEREYHDQNAQAEADSISLYRLLEEEIVPAFFERKNGLPHRWLGYMKEAIRTCTPQFSMRRMVKEYTQRYYIPEIQQSMLSTKNQYEYARTLAIWKERVRRGWSSLELYIDGRREGQLSLGEGIDVRAWVRVNNELTPEDLSVELVYGEVKDELALPQHALPMSYSKREQDGSYRYDIHLQPDESGSIAYNVRVVPTHPELKEKYELGLIRWA